MEGVNEHTMKSVTDAIAKLNLGNIGHTLERLDKRLSTLTGKVEGMETQRILKYLKQTLEFEI
jgi:hypothetical protein